MEEFLAIANKLSGVSFATLLTLILYGSWKRIWVWGRDLSDAEERFRNDLKRMESEREWWQGIAVKATGIAELQGHVLRAKEQKEQATIDTINQQLLQDRSRDEK